jgi:hypothetical protein
VISSLEVGAAFRIQDLASAQLREIAGQLRVVDEALAKVKGSLVELAESKFPGLTRRIGTLTERMEALGVSAQKGADGIDKAFASTDAAIGTTIGRVQQLKAELASLNAPALGGGGGGGGGRRWGGAARGHGGGGGLSAHESLGPVSFRGHGDGTVAGAVGAFSVWEALKASADLQQVQANLAASGVSPGEIARATSFAYGFSDYGLSARDILQSINEIRNPLNKGTTADSGVEDAMRHMPTLSAAANVLRAQGGRNGGDTARELYDLVKSAEFRNAISDTDFDKAINSMVKADVATGGIVTPRTFLQMSQMLKGALPGLSDQYLYTIMPELAQEFRGQQAGTAATSLYSSLTNFLALLGGDLMPAATTALRGLTALLQDMAKAGAIFDRNNYSLHNDPNWWSGVWHRAFGGGAGNSGPHPRRNSGVGGFWTLSIMKHVTERLENEAGLSPMGAAGLVARWAAIEAPGGPTAVNPRSGASGINQALGSRLPSGYETWSLDKQLDYIINTDLQSPDQRRALGVLRHATTPARAAIGPSMYERAEGFNGETDNYTNYTPVDSVYNTISAKVLRMPEHPHSAVHHVTINIDGKRVATAVQKSIVDSNTQVRGPSNYDGRSIPTPVDSGYQHNF